MNNIRRAARNSPLLNNLPSTLVNINAPIDILQAAKRHQSLAVHVTEIAIGADEIRAPRSLRRAELLGRLAGVVGHDQVVGHPGWAGALVDWGRVAFAGLACGRGEGMLANDRQYDAFDRSVHSPAIGPLSEP